jgi:CubicO group peptidase (beta-lactamase class C family)
MLPRIPGSPPFITSSVLPWTTVLDHAEIKRFIRAAGYEAETPLAVGVSLPSGLPVFVAQGESPDARLFDAETIAYAGSLAKQMTGACAALLARDGTLDLDAPIATWLPELPAWSKQIRIRHLIHHTGGLSDTKTVWELMEQANEADWSSAGVCAALARIPRLEHEPGQTYAYSNVGYVCLGRIIEQISGQSLAALARALLFEPLQMRSTTFWSGPALRPPNAVALPTSLEPAPLSVGDGGLWTSVHDLLLWNAGLLGDALGVSHTLHTPGRLDDGTPLDYAWGVRIIRARGLSVQTHGGTWEGATAKLVRLPDRRASFAALALDSSVERMLALSSALQDALARDGNRTV